MLKPKPGPKPYHREPMTQADKEYNTRMDRQAQLQWIGACLDSDRLTKWEVCFVENLKGQLDYFPQWPLSERQAEVLERVYAKKT